MIQADSQITELSQALNRGDVDGALEALGLLPIAAERSDQLLPIGKSPIPEVLTASR